MLHSGDAIQVGNFPFRYEEKSVNLSPAATPLRSTPAPDWPSSSPVARSQSSADNLPIQSGEQAASEHVSRSPVAEKHAQVSAGPVSSLPDVPSFPARPVTPGGSSPDILRGPTPSEQTVRRIGAPITPFPLSYVGAQAPAINLAEKQLQFSAFYPREVPAESWQTLLVYAHVEDTLDAVRKDAQRLHALLDAGAPCADVQAAHPLSIGTQLSVVPVFQGVTFQPERVSFTWTEEWHPAAFRFFCERNRAGSMASGEVLLLAGPLIIASLRVSLHIGEPGARPEIRLDEISVARYKNIFASYSHEDVLMGRAIRQAYEALGDDSFADLEALRAGQSWHSVLARAIDRADVFQLFWSQHAASSSFVCQECQYALQHYKYEGFIRPIYWEQPLAFCPPELGHLRFTYYEPPG
jgi:hypothetical protein